MALAAIRRWEIRAHNRDGRAKVNHGKHATHGELTHSGTRPYAFWGFFQRIRTKMTLQSATERLDAAVQLLEDRLENRVRALRSEAASLRLERDTLQGQLLEAMNAVRPDLEEANALLQAELEAMATAHDALLEKYNELERRHTALEQAANDALGRVDRLIAQLDVESVEA